MSVLPFPQPELSHFDEWWSLQFHKTGKVMAKAKWDRITSPEGLHKGTGQVNQRICPDPLTGLSTGNCGRPEAAEQGVLSTAWLWGEGTGGQAIFTPANPVSEPGRMDG